MVPENSSQFVTTYATQALAKMPTPVPMTEERAKTIRIRCTQLEGAMLEMESMYGRVPPNRWQEVHKRYVMARLSRSLIYFQIFRINDLPTEIISLILRHVVWSGTIPEAGILNRLRITWVCKRWREVALGDSTLWSAIWFRDQPPHPRSFCWFDRAGATTLDIRVSEPRDNAWTGPQMEVFLDKILTKGQQIRSIVVTVDNWPPALVVLDKLSTYCLERGFPQMERFELHRSGSPYVWIGAGYEPDRHRNPMALFGGVYLPSLRHVTINGIHIDWAQSVLSNLSRLDLRRIPLEMSPTLDRFRDILKSCPTLVKLSLDGAGPAWRPRAADNEPVVLPHLKHLVIGDYSLQYALYVMYQLKAPNVRDLTLMNLIGEDYAPLFAVITGSFPEVRILTTFNIECGMSASKVTMLKWLRSMPKLTYWRLANLRQPFIQLFLSDFPTSPSNSEEDAQQQPADIPRQPIAPQLKYLDALANDPELVVNLVVTRRSMGVPFRKVFIDRTLATKFSSEQSAMLLSAGEVYIMPTPMQTVEEQELLVS